MVAKFDRVQIASVNKIQSRHMNNMGNMPVIKKTAVPGKETFKYIFDNARKGNEMAAVLLDEWQKNCEPKGNKEKQVFQLINKAADEIFK
ncbi:MAG: hypothetical protein ACM3TR_14170 [Caulobacteraceae bacterium]